MEPSLFQELLYNVSLLVSTALIFDVMTAGRQARRPWLAQILLGMVLGTIGMAVMLTPWVYAPGIVFDTRSILLGIAGLFFGAIPTLIAMLMTAALRLYQGGAAALTGVLVILLTGAIGILWRRYRRGSLPSISGRELYLFGLVLHLAMLAAMLTLPRDALWSVLAMITLPVLLIYPVGTTLLGKLMANRLRREQVDSELHASEVRMRTIIDSLPVPLALKHEQRFTYLNAQFVATFGYTIADIPLVADWWTKAYPDPAYRKQMMAAWNVLRSGTSPGNVRATDCRVLCKDGTERRIDVSLVVLDDFDLIVFHDLTEILRANERLRRQAALLDKATDAIIVLDLEHRITYWNDSAAAMYGWSGREMLGRSTDLFYQDQSEFLAAFEKLLSDGEWQGELQQIARDGSKLTVDARWTLVYDDQGAPQAVLVINTDITERKKLESQFLRVQRMESLGTLAGGIAHDLNNILSPVLLGVGMLKRQQRTPAELRLLDNMERSVQQGAALVRQVLTFARGVDGPRTKVNVPAVIEEVATFIHNTFPRNIELVVTLADDLYPIHADATQIHQVLLNLAVNGRDAMPEGGRLTLSVANTWLDEMWLRAQPQAKPGPYILLVLEDTGTGIPAEIRERVFDPFFTTKETGKGTGLGLATVQAVVKSHRGLLNLYSEEGRGTTVKIYLPALTEGQATDAVRLPTELPRGQGELILVVDDEVTVREVTGEMLQNFGYRVLTAEHGAHALDIYTEHAADIAVVLTDMMMPVMDGHALIQALYRLNPTVKIIAASGLSSNGMVARAAGAGVQHFLPKPYSAETLLSLLVQVLYPDGTEP